MNQYWDTRGDYDDNICTKPVLLGSNELSIVSNPEYFHNPTNRRWKWYLVWMWHYQPAYNWTNEVTKSWNFILIRPLSIIYTNISVACIRTPLSQESWCLLWKQLHSVGIQQRPIYNVWGWSMGWTQQWPINNKWDRSMEWLFLIISQEPITMDIWEPCNYASNLAYDRLMFEMCLQEDWAFSPQTVGVNARVLYLYQNIW